MKLNRIHAVVGTVLVLVPFTGFTRDIKYGFMIVGGAVILYFAVNSIHIELRKKHRRPHRHDTFVEGKPKKTEQKVGSEEVEKQEFETPPSHIAENNEPGV